MVAGHLQEKKGHFYIVLNCKDEEGKRKPKWIPTGLTVKGNKKRAEALLLETRVNFSRLLNAAEKEIIVEEIFEEKPVEEPVDHGPLFSEFMLQWLAMMKHQVEFITYASYYNVITNHVVPYFEEKRLFLKELLPCHIQDYYQYELDENGVTTNTVLHYHANIRKALKHALKNDLINTNPADKIERPKKNDFVGSFYNKQETNILFKKVKGELIELAVILAAFYGLRRSEVVGLKWTAINFENKTISIRHTVTPVYFEGQEHIIEKDRGKNKPSRRTLPLVPAFEELLLRIRELQALNEAICGKSYCTDYEEYIYLDKLGQRIKPGYITQNFTRTLKKNGLRHIRYHDLRHSCASLLLANGVSMKEIQEWLGHSNYSTTANIYSHLEYSSKVSSASTMSGVLVF
ncbi:tyrosine-type recombinase/integrase [Paenibacillus odorifer]|uniref:tyrosine-type recombinase/integrase n=1 Tax=Paenibacillus odorifer TaxID=189426 RepID=UPI00096F4B82|nr:site-specific integrase [Paenibacillus odorifer]OME13243.1 site-specific integrase [Paenibacillus odorifer]